MTISKAEIIHFCLCDRCQEVMKEHLDTWYNSTLHSSRECFEEDKSEPRHYLIAWRVDKDGDAEYRIEEPYL